MTSRDVVLGRLRAALAAAPPGPVTVPRDYLRGGDLPPDRLVDLFADRLLGYRAHVHRCADAEIAGTIAAILAGRPVVVPPGLPPHWLPSAADVHRDDGPASGPHQGPDAPDPGLGDRPDLGLGGRPERGADGRSGARRLAAVQAVVTGAAVAIAETGTVVLDGSAGQGRRALSLLPDLHVCVVRPDQVVATVSQALARLDPRRPLTWISGPSATSDIELDRVEGVHGPRRLHVVLVEGA